MAIKSKHTVIVIGAGPVGLLTALRLGQAGISTLVLEAHHELLPTTRAMVYMPVVIPVLRKLGILEIVQEHAYLNHGGVVWRKVNGEPLAHLPLSSSDPSEFGGVLLIGQAKMNALILEEVKKYPNVEVLFGWRCVGIEDLPHHDSVKVMVHQKAAQDDDKIFEGDYILATDGANSTVRRMLCIPFEGFTYEEFVMIGCDVIYDFVKENGLQSRLNFVVHPEDWAVIAYTGEDDGGKKAGTGEPQWRVAYVEPPDLPQSKQEIMQRAHQRVPRFLKNTKIPLRITRAELYMMHQQCAGQARKGRIMLAGDALHSNNPIGGLGLTGGILDAFAYRNALSRVITGGEEDALLTDCANSRRQAWHETTNMLSQANMKRLYGFDEETIKAREAFFHRLKTDESFSDMIRKGFDRMMPESFEKDGQMPLARHTLLGNGDHRTGFTEKMEELAVQ